MAFLFPETLVALTAGIRTVPTEFVMADGNRMQGRAIPVSTPYILRASELFNPYSFRQAGIEAASTLWSSVTIVRFAVSGRDRLSSPRILSAMTLRRAVCKSLPWRERVCAENMAEKNSPATIPAAASRIEGVCPPY